MDKVNNEEEKLLISNLKGGDEHAFTVLYNKYSPAIYVNILKLVKAEEVALDVLQELFIKIWNHRESIDPDKDFRAYLFRITYNQIRDFFRKAARDRQLTDRLVALTTEGYEHIERLLQQKETAAILDRAIDALPTQQRRIFILCRVEGRSYEEVATMLELSIATIGNQLSKATKNIRSQLNTRDLSYLFALGIVGYTLA
ncbi:RNA polymerase sigma factor [Parapedobacter lycopersici]|uniref:RNA polymerase sigma factor n=1 Tax=Parapedobacter lycopersici TaxID=1864939 RepID=UPI00214DA648|nr:RNA polymerase sigma-70 factor [Parapedobacter lycopersici]